MNSDKNALWVHSGYTIIPNGGLNFSDSSLRLIESYIIVMRSDQFACGIAFAISTVEMALQQKPLKKLEVEGSAKAAILEKIGSGGIQNRQEYTFEYSFDEERYIEVENPRWWHKGGL